jgi:polyhydroxyalkanoate synthesis repressor PhaR
MTPNKSDKTAKSSSERAHRVIKRYSNRKLYDTVDSRYVTLLQIAEMVRAGENVQIIDNASKEDKTEVTLALIISEELKAQPRGVPLGTLRELIQERGGKPSPQAPKDTIGRPVAGGGDGGVGGDPGGQMTSGQRNEDAGNQGHDRGPTGQNAGVSELLGEIARLTQRVAALEARLGHPTPTDEQPRAGGRPPAGRRE